MQRRRISADIVTNPSASARIPNSVDNDSFLKSQNVDRFKHQCSSILRHDITVSAEDLMLRCSGQDKTLVQDLQAASGLIHKPITTKVTLDNASVSSGSGALSRVHHSHELQDVQSTDFARQSHSVVDYGKYPSPAHSTDSDAAGDDRVLESFPVIINRSPTHNSGTNTASRSYRVDHKLPTPNETVSNIQTPPSLYKESVRQYSYVDSLVDVATLITNTLWPCTLDKSSSDRHDGIRMIGHFITETSRKSKTSLSTMQLALLYCIKFKRDQNNLSRAILELEARNGKSIPGFIPAVGSTCARRNFLSALILASKYLQDQNFSNKAWSKISSVSVSEINLREREFLEITRWNLDVKHDVFKNWSTTMESFICQVRDNTIFGDLDVCHDRWSAIVRRLMLVSDSQMSTIMGQLASSETTMQFNEQLETPAATPVVELLDFILPTGQGAAAECSAPTIETAEALISDSSISETCPCPFFEEFIQCTPAEPILHTAYVGPEDNYATPESLRTASPALTEADFTREHVHGEITEVVPSCVPPTPKGNLYGSFSHVANEELGSAAGMCRKRKFGLVEGKDCNGFVGREGSIASRRRDGKALKRLS